MTNGLAVSHAYSIIRVFEIKYEDGKYDAFRDIDTSSSVNNIKLLL